MGESAGDILVIDSLLGHRYQTRIRVHSALAGSFQH